VAVVGQSADIFISPKDLDLEKNPYRYLIRD
jgi:hypothetical protein